MHPTVIGSKYVPSTIAKHVRERNLMRKITTALQVVAMLMMAGLRPLAAVNHLIIVKRENSNTIQIHTKNLIFVGLSGSRFFDFGQVDFDF